MLVKIGKADGGWRLIDDIESVDFYHEKPVGFSPDDLYDFYQEENDYEERHNPVVLLYFSGRSAHKVDWNEIEVNNSSYIRSELINLRKKDGTSIKFLTSNRVYILNDAGKTIETINVRQNVSTISRSEAELLFGPPLKTRGEILFPPEE